MPQTNEQDDKPYVSMLDLQADTEEIMGLNPEADANALVPPVPAGVYFAKFSFTGEDPEKRWLTGVWGKNEQKVIYTSITSELYNTNGGVYDGRQVRDRMVSSMIRQQTGTCRIQGLVQAITGSFPPACKSRLQMVQLVNDLMAAQPTGEVEIDWEASENLTEEQRDMLKQQGKRAFRLQGMKNFPKDADGNYIPEVTHNGEIYRAYNVVNRYITASGSQGEHSAAQQPQAQAPAATQQMPRLSKPVVQTQQTQQAQPQGPPVPPRAAVPRSPQAPRTPPRAA